MKQVVLTTCLCLLAMAAARAQSRIFIPVDNQECVNCLSGLHYAGMLDSSALPTLVFQQRYRRDSAALVKRLHLQSFRNRLVWSDSLYNLFRGRGMLNSSVSLYNAESGKVLRTGFVQIADNLPFLRALNRPADTITLDRSFIGGAPNFGNTGSYFYNFDNVSKELLVFDKTNSKHLYTLSLSDSLVEVAFRLRFGSKWKDAYQKVSDYTNQWQTVDPQAYCSYYCCNDTVYLMAQHHYLIYPEEGATGIETTVFLSLSEYKNGELVRFSLVENYLDPLMKGKEGGIPRVNRSGQQIKNRKAHYTLSHEFLVYRNELYPLVLGGFSKGIPNHFLAKYNYDAKDHTYKFRSLYDRSLPVQYDSVGYNYTNSLECLLFSPPYTALYLSSHLFSLDEAMPDLQMDIFGAGNRPRTGNGIWDIKVGAAHAYLVYLKNRDNCYHYLKYDLKAKRVVTDKVICNFKSPDFVATPMLDDFDYSYIYLPIGESTIVRKRMAD